MPEQLPATKLYKYLIRPDGSIRVVSRGPVHLQDDELLVEKTTLRSPAADFYYDFDTEELRELTAGQKVSRRNERSAVRDAKTISRAKKVKRLKQLLPNLSSEVQELFSLLVDLADLDVS